MANYLITGTSRGLGLELVSQLAASPSSSVNLIFATGRTDAPSEALQEVIDKSGHVIYIKIEGAELDSVQAAFSIIEKTLDGSSLDYLVNNVGVMPFTPAGVATMNDLTSTFITNVATVHNTTSVFLPLLAKSSVKKVLNMSSTLGSIALANQFTVSPAPAYKISKAALNMLTVQYALEYASKGFVIFAISPGWVKTDLGTAYADLTVDESVKAVLERLHGAGKDANGKFFNVKIPGWEKRETGNQYPGGEEPW
ncbi:short chain oxidoreductase [Phlyctema vagabunda]|uniref:Short chain oxidoreductase n=1 Tax=Phlyctema vagabunda TaxID=108571 RepID=A0ABR4P8V5_9HELO